MKNNRRKIISGFFLLLGLAPVLFLLFGILQKKEIREKMKEKLETDKLQTIVLPEEKVIWMDKHEIWVNEHMFDIHSKKLENGIYTFTGLYDEDETLLIKKQQQTSEKSQHQTKLLTQLFKCLHGIYHTQVQEPGLIITKKHYLLLFSSSRAVEQFREILTPPPQV